MKVIKKALLLNKAFSGGWLDQEDHIGHEIIDLILSDDGTHYVYYSPWGSVDRKVVVEGDNHFRKRSGAEIEAKYLVLTGQYYKAERYAEILYVIELEEKLHNKSFAKKGNLEKAEDNYVYIKGLIDRRNIKYNNVPLYEAYPRTYSDGEIDRSLFVTFKARRIYKANVPLKHYFTKSITRGNNFIISEDEPYARDYSGMLNLITTSIADGNLVEFTPKSLVEIQQAGYRTTFFDLIDYGEVEQAFTNILYGILKQGNLIKRFCETFKRDEEVITDNILKVGREKKVVDGRMDVCASSTDQKVIIENKINSGLNGLKADNSSQLSIYYNWGRENTILHPLCFLTFPDIYITKIKKDIENHDPAMVNIYNLVTYGQVAEFLENNRDEIPQTYEYFRYVDDIILAFKNLSYKTKEHYYAQKFLQSTLDNR